MSAATPYGPACGCITRSSARPDRDPAAAGLGHRPLAHVEDAGALPRPPLPRHNVRPTRQRPVRPAAGRRRLRRSRAGRRRAGHPRCHGDAPRGVRRAVDGFGDRVAPGRRAPVAGCGGRLRRARSGLGAKLPERWAHSFEDELDTDEGWAKYNAPYWRRDYADFADFFFGNVYPEAHSTKHREDAVGWALQTDAETLIATARAPYLDGVDGSAAASELAARVTCPSWSSTATRTASSGGRAGRRWPRSWAASWSRSRAAGTASRRATRCGSTPSCGASWSRSPAGASDACLAVRPRAAPSRPVGQLADRSGSHPARSRDRSLVAIDGARRADRMAGAAAGDRSPRGGRRDRPSGERGAGLGSGALGGGG